VTRIISVLLVGSMAERDVASGPSTRNDRSDRFHARSSNPTFMDALSQMLELVQMRTSIYATVRLQAPWGVGIRRMPAAAFHAILAGQCWLHVGEHAVALGAGDVVVLPHGDAHRFCHPLGAPIEE